MEIGNTGGGIDLRYKLRCSVFDVLNLGSQGIVKWAFSTGNLKFLFGAQTGEIKDHIDSSRNHRNEGDHTGKMNKMERENGLKRVGKRACKGN